MPKMKDPFCRPLKILAGLILAHTLIFSQIGLADSSSAPIFFEGQIDRAALLETLKAIDIEQYPDADLVVVARQDRMIYRENGTYQHWQECYTKVLTEKGRRQGRSITSSFSERYNTTEFMNVELIKTDGAILKVDIKKNSQIAVDSEQIEGNIYDPNEKFVQLNIPGLEIGDTLHIIVFDNHFKTFVPGAWGALVGLESIYPIKHQEVTVVAPRTLPLKKMAVKSEITGPTTYSYREDGDRVVYNWVARDVPMAFPEPDMPELSSQTQRLLVSTIAEWPWLSRWYWKLSEAHINALSPEVEKTVFDLTRNMASPDEKVNAIFKWVSQEIRYLGLTVEGESPGFEPHPARVTFERRAGVCRDKAALLVAMLRVAGFDAYPVLFKKGPRMDREVPLPYFDHAIAAVRNRDGSYRLMDPADEAAVALLPPDLGNKSYLVATPEGDILRTSPIEPVEQNMVLVRTDGELGSDGVLRADSVFHFNGINENYYRSYLSEKSPLERRLYFERVINANSFSAEIKTFQIEPENLMDTSRPLRVKLTLEATGVQAVGGQAGILKPPFIGNRIGMVHFQVGKFALEERRFPLETDAACGIHETFAIKVASEVAAPIGTPDFKGIENEALTWRQQVSLNEGIFSGESLFQMKLPEYSPQQYDTLRSAFGQIELGRSKMLVFRVSKGSGESEKWWAQFQPDAVVLEEKNDFELKDESNWTVSEYTRLKVLTQAGKNRYGDIQIPYHPALGSIAVKRAQVVSPSGKTLKTAEHEINVMDAKWVGDAPRYSPERVLVVSFPGVEIGSIIEFEMLRTFKNQPFFSIAGGLAGEPFPFGNNPGVFRYFEPIVQKTLKVKYPKSIRLNFSKKDRGLQAPKNSDRPAEELIRQEASVEGQFNVIEFSAKNIEPAVRENNLPPWMHFNPVVVASTGSWPNYSAEQLSLLVRASAAGAGIKNAAVDLTSGKTDIEKVKAVRDFVATKIRMVDIGYTNIPGVGITNAEDTLSDGYGHTIDRAVLLFALMKEAGLEPEFVLSTWPTRLKDFWSHLENFPNCNWFDALLVLVRVDGINIYLNDTNHYAQLGTTASDGYPGLFLSKGQIDTIRVSSPDLESAVKSRYEIDVRENASALIKVTNLFFGTEHQAFHQSTSEMTPEKRRRRHLERAVSLSQRAVPVGEYITDARSYPAREVFSVEIEDFAICQNGYCYLKLPGLENGIKYARTENRTNPICLSDEKNRSILVTANIPVNFKTIELTPPASIDFAVESSGSVTHRFRWASSQNLMEDRNLRAALIVEQVFNLKELVIDPVDYKNLRDFSRFLEDPASSMVLIKMHEVKGASAY